tara:strand:- start:190 stop:360 length:171 start_codon:yes stop_codon:yes gene_type:complete
MPFMIKVQDFKIFSAEFFKSLIGCAPSSVLDKPIDWPAHAYIPSISTTFARIASVI